MLRRSLLISKPDGSTEVFEINKPVIRIGRREDNDLVFDAAHRGVSRLHAQILCDREPPVVEDLNSANGTLLNGTRISSQTPLRDGDVVRIGLYTLTFRVGEPTADAAPEPMGDASARFDIEAAAVNLEHLQDHPRLLDLAGGEQLVPEKGFDLRALELLHDVSVRLARSVTTADVAETAISLLFRIQGVQRATLMPWDEDRREFQDAKIVSRNGGSMGGGDVRGSNHPRSLVLSSTILGKVREENRPLHIRDARSMATDAGGMSIVRAGIQAALCSPLTFQGRFLGVLYADNLMAPDTFSPADFRTFTSIAAQTGMAMASAVARQALLRRDVEQAAMRLYLPAEVAAQIIATEGSVELGGALQPVTVLFADIRGFTSLSEQMNAHEVVLMLNEFFTVMTEVILEAGGTLDKFVGDCVMALFGAPIPRTDDVQRALRAAVNMQREVAHMNAKRLAHRQREVKIGVGLHCGPAVVGNIGSVQRMQYTAIGDTVNVASRVAEAAGPDQVLVSEPVRAAVANGSSFEHLGEVKLKGLERKVSIYSVPWETVL